MADPRRGRVRGPCRMLGAVLGVLFVVAGGVLVVRTSYELAVHRQDVSRVVLERLALGVGDGAATAYGCDLTKGYIDENAAYYSS